MKRTEMMALSSRGHLRTALERASAWLLARLGQRSWDASGWVTASEIEAARARSGVSRATLSRARRSLLKTGRIEKRRRGYQGAWMYRLVDPESKLCPLCGAVNGRPAPVEPAPAQPTVALRFLGHQPWFVDDVYGTGLMWFGHGDIQPIADIDKARRMARNHPDVYELIEVEPD